jgi:GDP-4-dehydro-6-deoxy-D-mannose reductase
MSGILITGSNGFLGHALCERLSKESHNIFKLDIDRGDITDRAVFRPFAKEDIRHVFHLAARTYVPDSWDSPFDFYHTNVMGTENVLEFCRLKKSSLIYVSAYIYGQPDFLPVNENHPVRPNNPYAHSKYLAEQLCEFYARYFEVKTTIIRPFNIYGAGQGGKFLIPHITHQALHDRCIAVKDLHPRRDYVYLDDVVDVLTLTMNLDDPFSILNIGSGYSLSVKEIIDIIQDVAGTEKLVETAHVVRENELADVIADIKRVYQKLHWKPKHDFRAGITKVIDAMKKMRP